MAKCSACGEEADELVRVKQGAKSKRLCEDCADELSQSEEIEEASEAAVQQMMGFTGRR
ncbi:MAG: hypothetical protein KF915_07825 [Polyangiaceae bacterium]|nr:hypothetical protein [Polyangiaceae bacterium]